MSCHAAVEKWDEWKGKEGKISFVSFTYKTARKLCRFKLIDKCEHIITRKDETNEKITLTRKRIFLGEREMKKFLSSLILLHFHFI